MPPFLILYFCNQLLLSCGWQLLFLMDKLSVFIRNNVLLYLDQSNETVLLQFLFQSHFIFFCGGCMCMCVFYLFLTIACCYSCFDFGSVIFMPQFL